MARGSYIEEPHKHGSRRDPTPVWEIPQGLSIHPQLVTNTTSPSLNEMRGLTVIRRKDSAVVALHIVVGHGQLR